MRGIILIIRAARLIDSGGVCCGAGRCDETDFTFVQVQRGRNFLRVRRANELLNRASVLTEAVVMFEEFGELSASM